MKANSTAVFKVPMYNLVGNEAVAWVKQVVKQAGLVVPDLSDIALKTAKWDAAYRGWYHEVTVPIYVEGIKTNG